MANRKLISYSIDELKEKITRFYFTVGGFFGGHDRIVIFKDNTQIKYICNEDENTLNKEKWNEFIDKIFNENILNWKNKYFDNNICDGEQWELEMEFKDLPKFESFGSNEYPRNWEKILTIIYEYFPQIKPNYDDEDAEE